MTRVTVPVMVCFASVCLCLYVALLTARLSRVSGWQDQKLLALAALMAAAYLIGDVPQEASDAPGDLVALTMRWQVLASAGYNYSWLFYSRNFLKLRRGWFEPVFAGIGTFLSALTSAGLGIDAEQVHTLRIDWLGVTYRYAELKPIGTAAYAVTIGASAVVAFRFGRAFFRGRRDVLWYFIGTVFLVLTAWNDLLVTAHVYANAFLIDVGEMAPLAAIAVAQTGELVQISLDRDKKNAELELALAAANEAARLKSEFLANTSHELRTPLNAIINIPVGLRQQFQAATTGRCPACGLRVELEEEDLAAPELRCPDCNAEVVKEESLTLGIETSVLMDHLGTVERAGKHLLSVVDDILDVSKLEAGRMTLSRERVRVSTLFADLARIMKPSAERRAVELRLDHGDADFEFSADPVRWMQIMMNLVSNAVKFSNRGGHVDVSARPNGDGWTFSVRDFGIGIAPEHQRLVFEPFRQVDGGHTRAVGGTGLGLTLTRKLVELHGGRVELESALGEGTTVTVRLPAAANEDMSLELDRAAS